MLVNIISSLVAILFIFILFRVFYRKYALNLFRENLFSLRRKLFNTAIKNNINFDSSVYRNSECLINNTIRYAHNIDILTLLLFALQNRIVYPEGIIENRLARDIKRDIENIKDPKIKSKLHSIHRSIDKEILFLLIRTSIIFDIYFVFRILFLLLHKVFRLSAVKAAITKDIMPEISEEIELQAEMYCLAT